MNTWERALVGPATTIRDALERIDAARTQMALVVDGERRLLGTLSDGDIRRGLIRGLALTDPVELCVHRAPTVARVGESREAVVSLMRRTGLHQVPIVDERNVVCGLQVIDDYFVPPVRDNWVVVMAGGLGTRLGELTSNTPKPMLNVGGRPLLETILRTFVDQGFRRFYLAVNYKAEVIERHFRDGSALGAEIRYLREATRMGTAGALSLIEEMPRSPIVVTNGDLLVKIDFSEMLEQHLASGAVATMGVREYEFQIPYGVVRESDGAIKCIEEKPVHRSLVSAGMYILSPEVLALVPRDSYYDMPSLFDEIISTRRPTRCFSVRGYWLDIGRMADYQKANHDFPEVFE